MINPETVLAILSVMGIGVIGVVQFLKNLLKLDGVAALILTAVVSFGATAFYFYSIGAFSLLNLILYGLVVFGEASGLYKVITK